MAESTQLTNNVTSGVAWSVAEKIGSALLQAVVSIVVANAIMPMDMGIMAVLTVFTTLAQVVVDSGFSQTLIRKAAPTAEEYRAVFRFNILSSLILYALLSIASPAIARYYGWPLLATVAPVLFLLLPLNALCVIQNTIMVREFRFAQLSTITFASSLISGIIAITMALTGFGIWSLVGQRVSMMAAKAAMLWWKSNWRPRSAQRASSLREMAPYSLRLMTTDIINSLYNNIAQLFIGNIYSGSVLGYFNQAQKLKDMPVNSTMQSVQSVTFPALSKIGDNDVKFSEGYRRVVMLTAFVMFPIMAGLIATAEDIYTLLLKPRWHP
ncbi:MAG: lipopolysaccharide biosynthesis protein, partial [Alistipes sp.]|nr:lipopolysaccharide biosynthesis protein [Alistipes sp.]